MGRKKRPATTHGIAVVDKPTGVTSHDVVAMLRKRFDERQVGHGGTLDPSATGVLVVAVGKATKLLRFVEKTRKAYIGEIVLGTETDSLDADGEVTVTHDMPEVSLADAQAMVDEHLTGDIEQVPPMVSAIKIDGKRLHELAREGIEVERPPRPVTIYSFQLMPTDEPNVFLAAVECTPGTYIRTLAADLGHLLGGGAHLRNLRRTAVGRFTIGEAKSPDECELLPVEEAVRTLDRVDMTEQLDDFVSNGRVLPAWEGEGPWALFRTDGTLAAVYERHGSTEAKPMVVVPR
ncbi:tRNA pseudouridine(55) synthase TruB [Ilumatobacter coccineus]|uniref:tRNA pseudouridine synthase B n=1 Tax=Ilumatobacter coccineus (strain NBRC 103263 / KCTC 29153 / YM16-304) TaxID=1313172 RepID=A0A6C7E653_ILUCY|nr:tRNA pseudouridine(55) synthase TruB [Ilumatobacter coccineus]BAN01913.1 tRNA pseudouridine synthase B [Ilumatobacter coccineus YM16-304]